MDNIRMYFTSVVFPNEIYQKYAFQTRHFKNSHICWELFVNNSPECDSNLWASVHNNSEHKLSYVVTQDFIYSNTDICILMKG